MEISKKNDIVPSKWPRPVCDIGGPYSRWLRQRTALLSAMILLFCNCHHADRLSEAAHQSGGRSSADQTASGQTPVGQVITPIPFDEMNGNDVYNASGVIPIGDSRFLFCDNNSADALYELDLKHNGRKKGSLIKHKIHGLAPGAVSDFEDLTSVKEKGRRFVFVTSSLSVKKAKKEEPSKIPSSGLLRVTIDHGDNLIAENMADFRNWFVRQVPELTGVAEFPPEEGGINIEGLAWDADRHALLFGLRAPVPNGKLLVVPVRVKSLTDRWTTDNLEVLPPIRLSIETTEGGQGIRSIEYIKSLGLFLIIIGRSLSGSDVPFALYQWDGRQSGMTKRLKLSFAKKMKPEGICEGKVDGKRVLVFVDDSGGYQILSLDQVRLLL